MIRRMVYSLLILMLMLGVGHTVLAQDGGTPTAPPDGTDLPLDELIFTADWGGDYNPSGQSEVMQHATNDAGLGIEHLVSDGGFDFVEPPDQVFSDFYTEFEFTVDTCENPNSAVLVSARLNGATGNRLTADQYVFVLECAGSYRSRALSGGAPTDIDTRGALETELSEGSSHVMGILMIGDEVTWFIDGTAIGPYNVRSVLPAGLIAFGAQRGMGYTITSWRVWLVIAGETDAGVGGSTSDDPIAAQDFGGVIYDPSFLPPTSIQYGLHLPVARYLTPNGISMYNNDPTAIMLFPEVDQSNYLIDISFGIRSCSDNSLIGLVWRAAEDQSSFYVFGIQCDGNYRVRAVVDGVPGDLLLEGQVEEPLPVETLLTASVFVRDETAWVYYNRELLGSFTDASLTEGMTGVLLQSASDGAKMDMIITDLTIFETD